MELVTYLQELSERLRKHQLIGSEFLGHLEELSVNLETLYGSYDPNAPEPEVATYQRPMAEGFAGLKKALGALEAYLDGADSNLLQSAYDEAERADVIFGRVAEELAQLGKEV